MLNLHFVYRTCKEISPDWERSAELERLGLVAFIFAILRVLQTFYELVFFSGTQFKREPFQYLKLFGDGGQLYLTLRFYLEPMQDNFYLPRFNYHSYFLGMLCAAAIVFSSSKFWMMFDAFDEWTLMLALSFIRIVPYLLLLIIFLF